MQQDNKFINKRNFTYEDLKLIEDHAKKYDSTPDKKNFLKSITPYEQKLVLLQSKNPYEVLMYLDELDMKNSRLVLSNLEVNEIVRIINMFTSEDKKRFYSTFSDLELVNQFIVYDNNASEHIEDLDIERKVDLLNSSDRHTLEATSKVYDSIQEEEKTIVVHNVTNTDGVLALNETTNYVADKQDLEVQEKSNETKDIKEESEKNKQESLNKEQEKEIEEELDKEKEEEAENKETEEKDKNEEIEYKNQPEVEETILKEFIMSRKEQYKDILPDFKDVLNFSFSMLSADIQNKIISDYEESKINKEDQLLEHEITPKLDEFRKVSSDCEQELINSIMEKVEEKQLKNDDVKTL